MTDKNLILSMTENAIDGFFSYAKAVPDDKIQWKPLDAGRTVLDMAQECAQSADWAVGMIAAGGFTGMDEARMKAMKEERSGWTTVEECERVRNFPLSKMDETVEVPFGKKKYPWWEILLIHYWNLNYHWGQVAYVQTLYGDHGYH
jgi:hypothetical protein